jgi:hypothetical protein
LASRRTETRSAAKGGAGRITTSARDEFALAKLEMAMDMDMETEAEQPDDAGASR